MKSILQVQSLDEAATSRELTAVTQLCSQLDSNPLHLALALYLQGLLNQKLANFARPKDEVMCQRKEQDALVSLRQALGLANEKMEDYPLACKVLIVLGAIFRHRNVQVKQFVCCQHRMCDI
eukprot:c8022_g1_i6.p1 GENE.c8022_g1_i6~~c8022_g1_i6.p1  ORF type:complete len:122 (+),score=24.62 c8022_g1_i6:102-467(+)